MLNSREISTTDDANDIGSDHETNTNSSDIEAMDGTPSLEIASASPTISTSTKSDTINPSSTVSKTASNQCDNQESLLNLLNSNFLACSICNARNGGIRLLPCLHIACDNCASELITPGDDQSMSTIIKCDACCTAGIQLRKQYNPEGSNGADATTDSNNNDDKYITIQHCSSLGTNSEIKVDEKVIQQFPNVLFVDKLRELANLLKQDAVHKCDYCMFENQNSEAHCRCIECGDNLCEPCAQAHKRTRITRLHTLLSYEEILANGYLVRMREAPPTQCTEHNFFEDNHDSEKLMMNGDHKVSMTKSECNKISNGHQCKWPSPSAYFYCKQCNKLLCTECSGQFLMSSRSNTHGSHLILPLDTVIHETKSEISEQIDRVKRKNKHFEDYLNHLVQYGHELNQAKMNILQQIQGRSDQLKQKIDQIAQKLISQLDKQIQDEMKLIDGCAWSLYPLIVQCEVASRYANALKDYGRPEEILLCLSQVTEQLQFLQREKIEYLKVHIKPHFKVGNYNYNENETETTNQSFNSSYLFGTIEYDKFVEEFIKNEVNNANKNKTNQYNELKLELDSSYLNIDHISVGVNTSPREMTSISSYNLADRFNNIHSNRNNDSRGFNSDNHLRINENFRTPRNGYLSNNIKDKTMNNECDYLSKYQLVNELEFDARVSSDLRDVWPTGLSVNQSNGDIYLVDRDNARIKLFTHDGTFISSLGDTGEMTDRLISPFDIAVSSTWGTIFVSDYQRDEVRLFTLDGRTQGSLTKTKLKHPRGLCYGLGLLAVVESRRHQISLYDIRSDPQSPVRRIPADSTGDENSNKFVFNSRTSLTEPYYVEILEESGGCLAITDWAAPSVKLFSLTSGCFLSSIGGYGTTSDNILQPYGICYAPWTRSFLIADHVNHRIQACQLRHIINSENDNDWTNDLVKTVKPSGGWNETLTGGGTKTSSTSLSPLKPIAEKGSHSIWHPMAMATDAQRKRIILTEALGSVKVIKSVEVNQ
uniref:B box-type domain-containing protein n=1 Tax=Trichobilharzia regenti TaxID=157069 RepID=A0AA85JZW6_TRIRE|nr:unnamed protein product [Trichobilharzia regenti]